jgi:hypothetical protein
MYNVYFSYGPKITMRIRNSNSFIICSKPPISFKTPKVDEFVSETFFSKFEILQAPQEEFLNLKIYDPQ